MRKQAGPSAKDLPDLPSAKKFINNEEHSVIGEKGLPLGVCVSFNTLYCLLLGFFTEEGGDMKDNFVSTANRMRDDFRFGMSSDAAVLEEFGYSKLV